MHDFCFTFPYAVLLLLGGLAGLAIRGSKMSLLAGGGSALLLALAGKCQLSAYKREENNWLAIFSQLGISVILSVVLGKRFMDTWKIMPAGIVAGLSVIMAAFYVFKVLKGGNKISKKVSTD